MKQFTKISLSDIPLEDAHGGSGKRKVLVNPEDITSNHLELVTKAFLGAGSSFDWHSHEDVDEIFIVLKGHGKFYCENEETFYKEDDVFSIHANAKHKITAEGNSPSEFYFVRIKV